MVDCIRCIATAIGFSVIGALVCFTFVYFIYLASRVLKKLHSFICEMLKYKALPIAKCRCQYCKYSQYVPDVKEFKLMKCSIFKTTVREYDFCKWATRMVD